MNHLDHINPELQARARTILAKLECLGEAPGKSIVPTYGHHEAPGSSAPPEAKPGRDTSTPPPKDRSLYAWYVFHFARATNDYRWRLLCYLAERDYERYRRRPDDSRRGPISLKGKDGGTAEAEGMRRIVEWYEGLDALEVAILEECSVQHVRKARRLHRRQEEDGAPRRGWDGWDDERRVSEIRALRARNMSQNKVAQELDISRRTVGRYWDHAEAAHA